MRRFHPERVDSYYVLGPPNPVSKLRPLLLVDGPVEPVQQPAGEASGPVDPSIPARTSSGPAVADSQALIASPASLESPTGDPHGQLAAKRREALPKYVQQRTVKGGTAYYWCKPSWARKAGCPIPNRPLGRNLERAKTIASSLNDRFDDWRATRSKRPGPS
jgi:hypothetical protein